MILPAPANVHPYGRYPLTWTLLALNIVSFLLIFNGDNQVEDYRAQKVLQEESVETTGRLYFQYLQSLKPEDLFKKPEWIHTMNAQNPGQMEVLGSYALRDANFLAEAERMKFVGDAIRIEEWREELQDFKKFYFNQPIFTFGLYSFDREPLAWITYQFSHSGWLHLLSNMIFLVIMGVAVEAIAGSSALLIVYFLGGVFGGLGFLLLNAHGTVPMVGASASVSALLAFYCVVEPRKCIRYGYFVTPFPGQHGFIYLPTYLIFPLFLLVDFGSLLATPDGLGSGVAYSAHIGGTSLGLIAGGLYLIAWKLRNRSYFVN